MLLYVMLLYVTAAVRRATCSAPRPQTPAMHHLSRSPTALSFVNSPPLLYSPRSIAANALSRQQRRYVKSPNQQGFPPWLSPVMQQSEQSKPVVQQLSSAEHLLLLIKDYHKDGH